MPMVMFTVIFSMTISAAIMAITLIVGKKTLTFNEKLSPFECGFDPYKKARIPFSLRFFLITILFLIFDVEIAILLPLGLFSFSMSSFSHLSATIILAILILGLLHEWNQGALNWLT
uniref:NADH-ubiquinone oxidoreductase chain 3 n=1 Tax=Pseudoniphargus sp. 1-Portugal TaxID=2212668 RepID=A0A345K5R7_9CRUS|nr:NADH dehydrogenase subunit 3 [Pseudoniphargus sp. 1-Portugal]